MLGSNLCLSRLLLDSSDNVDLLEPGLKKNRALVSTGAAPPPAVAAALERNAKAPPKLVFVVFLFVFDDARQERAALVEAMKKGAPAAKVKPFFEKVFLFSFSAILIFFIKTRVWIFWRSARRCCCSTRRRMWRLCCTRCRTRATTFTARRGCWTRWARTRPRRSRRCPSIPSFWCLPCARNIWTPSAACSSTAQTRIRKTVK